MRHRPCALRRAPVDPLSRRHGSARVEGVVEGPVECPGGAGQTVGQRRAGVHVDLEVRREETEHKTLDAEGEIVGGQATQPRELAALRGEAVREAQGHPHGQVAGAEDRADLGRFERLQASQRPGQDVSRSAPPSSARSAS